MVPGPSGGYNSGVISLLVLLVSLQEQESILKAQRALYKSAANSCREAEGLIDSDPSRAVGIIDGILRNTRIEKLECRLKIQQPDSSWDDPVDFFPLQVRGRAYLKLAEKNSATDPDQAKTHAEKSVQDLEASVKKGVRASQRYLDAANELVKKLSKPKDPAGELEAEWSALVDSRKFLEAKALIEGRRELSADKRKEYLDRTVEKCRRFVETATGRFLANLKTVDRLRLLETMKDSTFDRDFAVPDRSVLLEGALTPEYLWCVDGRPVLRDLRARQDAFEPLLKLAARAVGLSAGDEFGWFECTERLAHEWARNAMLRKSEEAREAPAARRIELRRDADKLRERWKLFEEEVAREARGRKAFLDRWSARDFTAVFERFPVEAAGLATLLGELLRISEAEDPERALRDLESKLERFLADWDRLVAESKLEILVCRIAAAALRGMLAGRPVEDLVADLKSLGSEYRSLGGKGEEKRFGRKVARIFAQLAK